MHKIHTQQNRCPDDNLPMKPTIVSPQGNMIIRMIKCEFYGNSTSQLKLFIKESMHGHTDRHYELCKYE